MVPGLETQTVSIEYLKQERVRLASDTYVRAFVRIEQALGSPALAPKIKATDHDTNAKAVK